ncbi:MAG: hypothetical protein V1899_08630 [Planctomycetota bacterium]
MASKSPTLPVKKWEIPKSKISAPLFWFLIGMASFLLVILSLLIGKMAMPTIEEGPPALAKKFKDIKNGYTICPPLNWVIQDPHDGWNLYLKAPAEKEFSSVIIVSLEIAPGQLASYLAEHRARIENQDKTIKWIGEAEEEVIDGCLAMKIEYDCDLQIDNDTSVKVRTRQYILEDRPRFYRITCHSRADKFDKYEARFDACARTFTRAPEPPKSILNALPTQPRL